MYVCVCVCVLPIITIINRQLGLASQLVTHRVDPDQVNDRSKSDNICLNDPGESFELDLIGMHII